MEITLTLNTLDDTRKLAKVLVPILKVKDVIFLTGDLGVGKTEFVRSFVHISTGKDEHVPSPTFTLLQIYDLPQGPLWHMDLYRIKNSEEIFELGFEDALAEGIVMIEWPIKLGNWTPQDYLEINLKCDKKTEARIVTISSHGHLKQKLEQIQKILSERGLK